MALFSRLEVCALLLRQGFLPLFHHRDPQTAVATCRALMDGGSRLVEFTNRGDDARATFRAIADARRTHGWQVAIGAGSVMDSETAAAYIDLGADFVVSPGFDEVTARRCNRYRVPYLPGACTPTEIARAEEFGSEIVKVFPGDAAGGPSFIRAVLGPSPRSRLMPTGGVEANAASLSAWFAAGAACVGLGSDLVRRSDMDAGDMAAITARVREVASLVAVARPTIEELWA